MFEFAEPRHVWKEHAKRESHEPRLLAGDESSDIFVIVFHRKGGYDGNFWFPGRIPRTEAVSHAWAVGDARPDILRMVFWRCGWSMR